MWNFGIPYRLKHYIDVILQPGYLFRYTANGPEGLVESKKMTVITSRGGDYGGASPLKPYDLQEPYIRAVFGFVGIADMTFVDARPMDAMGPAVRDQKTEEARKIAGETAGKF
jgi:FMN-dependent NADH-azoreductase